MCGGMNSLKWKIAAGKKKARLKQEALRIASVAG